MATRPRRPRAVWVTNHVSVQYARDGGQVWILAGSPEATPRQDDGTYTDLLNARATVLGRVDLER